MALALLVVLFFHEVSIGGKTFVSPDTTAPAGFVRMGEKALWEEHTYPLWNPYVFLGMPSFGSGAYNPLIYPPDWPVALVQKALPLPDMTWLLLYYFLGGLFLFLLAREWGASPEGALLGAAAFIFTPNLVAVGSHGHGSQLVDSAYLPLLLWLATRWIRRGGLHHLAWLALAGGFQLLRGHVQICFYTWMAIGLYVLVEVAARLQRPAELPTVLARGAGVLAAGAVAFGLAGVYNVPLQDYSKYSIRSAGGGGGLGMERATAWSLSPYELPSIVVPGWVGFGGATYWGDMPFTDYPNAYVGMVTVLLLVPAFLAKGAPRVFALLLALLSLFIAFGKHFFLYAFLYDHLPLFNKFRIPVMIILLFGLAAAVGVAWGWTATLRAAEEKPAARAPLDRLTMVLGVVMVAMLVIGVAGAGAWRDAYIKLALATKGGTAVLGGSDRAFPPESAAGAYEECARSLRLVAPLGLAAVLLAWLVARRKLATTLAAVVALGLLLGELWPVAGRVMAPVIGPYTPHPLDAGRDGVISFLEKAGPQGSFRIAPWDEMQTNRFAGFGIASVGGYHAAKPRLAQDFLDRQLYLALPWLRLLNVRYVVLTQHSFTPEMTYIKKQVYQGQDGEIGELDPPLPRATVVGAYQVLTPAEAILDSVAMGHRDSATMTYLTEDPHLTLGNVSGASATIDSYRLDDVTVSVDTPGPALLRLADLWYPDWVATVDGKPTTILRADYLLRAVAVPAGHHRVVFRYASPAVRRGLLLSLGCLALVLLGFAGSWVASRRGGAPAGGTPAAAAG